MDLWNALNDVQTILHFSYNFNWKQWSLSQDTLFKRTWITGHLWTSLCGGPQDSHWRDKLLWDVQVTFVVVVVVVDVVVLIIIIIIIIIIFIFILLLLLFYERWAFCYK